MTSRRITTVGSGPEPALDQELEKVFVAELIAPSRPLWIVSAWLSDVELVDNRGGEVFSIAPGLPLRTLRLVELIQHIVGAGGAVRVVVREEHHNTAIVLRLRSLAQRSRPGDLAVATRADLHDKVILSDRFLVEGSMNLTHRGRLANEEGVRFTTALDDLERQRLDLETRFGSQSS